MDPVKKIADLSEKLVNTKSLKNSDKELQVGTQCKAIVELNKETYLIVSIKSDRSKICLCISAQDSTKILTIDIFAAYSIVLKDVVDVIKV